jgi:hypothetical protein
MSRVIVALNPSRRIEDWIVFARFVEGCLGRNPVFVSPVPSLAVFGAHIAELEAAQAATYTGAYGARATRDAKLCVVRQELTSLQTYVQILANEHPGEVAAAIVQSAGMSRKNAAGPSKPDFEVKPGKVSGTVHLYARAAKTRASYEWQYRTAQTPWTSGEPTVRADATLSGLTPGVSYSFRYRTVTKAGVGDWSQVVTLIVR